LYEILSDVPFVCMHVCVCVCVCVETRKGTQFFFNLKVQLLLSRKCPCFNRLLSFNEVFTELFQCQNFVQSSKVFMQKIHSVLKDLTSGTGAKMERENTK
jgi:hypothetical protein